MFIFQGVDELVYGTSASRPSENDCVVFAGVDTVTNDVPESNKLNIKECFVKSHRHANRASSRNIVVCRDVTVDVVCVFP